MAVRIGLTADHTEFTLAAGEIAVVSLTLYNNGDVVDAFNLAVQDLPPAWYTLAPEQVPLFPRAQALATLQLHPPAGIQTLAGAYPFLVVAVSRDAPHEATTIPLIIHIATAGELRLELNPQRIVARRGVTGVRITNDANGLRPVVVRPSDPDAALVFKFGPALARQLGAPVIGPPATTTSTGARLLADPSLVEVATDWLPPDAQGSQGQLELTLPAASAVELPMVVSTRKPIWTGLETPLVFDVLVSPPGVEWKESDAVRARGELVYMPYLAPWSRLPLAARRLIGALVGLLILALLLFLLFRPTGSQAPNVVAAGLTATAVSTSNAGAASAAATLTAVASGSAGSHTGPPRITAFDFTTAPDGSIQIAWSVADADAVLLNNEAVPPTGSRPVNTGTDQSLTLVASNALGTVSQSKGVIVMRPPEIVTFTAEPAQIAPGQQVILSWHTVLAEKVSINGQPVAAPDGSVSTAPTTTTEYVLTAESVLGQVQRSITVNVIPPTP
jgi:hypothetical protein